jgi:hypothetical protein
MKASPASCQCAALGLAGARCFSSARSSSSTRAYSRRSTPLQRMAPRLHLLSLQVHRRGPQFYESPIRGEVPLERMRRKRSAWMSSCLCCGGTQCMRAAQRTTVCRMCMLCGKLQWRMSDELLCLRGFKVNKGLASILLVQHFGAERRLMLQQRKKNQLNVCILPAVNTPTTDRAAGAPAELVGPPPGHRIYESPIQGAVPLLRMKRGRSARTSSCSCCDRTRCTRSALPCAKHACCAASCGSQ